MVDSYEFTEGFETIPPLENLPNRPPEIPKDSFVPMICLRDVNHPEIPIPQSVQNETQRATLATLQMLGIDTSKYRQDFAAGDLIDLQSKNEKGELTLPRKPGTDRSRLVIVLSGNPFYDENGKEVGSHQTADNMVYISLPNLDRNILGNIPIEVKAGYTVIEETIHFVQREYWKRPKPDSNNLATRYDVSLHMKDPLEKEMHQYRQKIGNVLYPQIKMEFKGV